MNLFLQGLIIGFSIAAPVGPIGALCIRRTLAHGQAVGVASGLGAATADAIFGVIAGFGLTAVSAFLIDQQTAIRLVGGALLCWLGVRTLLSRPSAEPADAPRSQRLLGAYASTLALTLTNPASIILFAAIFAGLGMAQGAGSYTLALLLVAGLFLGSALWWLLLSSITALVRTRITPAALRWVNIVSGIVIAGFGIAAIATAL